MPPKFSIIIPVYNVAPYLRECLDSVLVQTFTDWEAICVDDGSTDGSGAILDGYAAKESRIRGVHQENGGVGCARNAGLEVAVGTWICFLDADDLWHRDFLSEIVSEMERRPECRLFRQGLVRFQDGTVCDFGQGVAEFRLRDVSGKIAPDDFCNHYFWEHVYHRDVIGPVRFPSYRRGEDRVFFNSILLNRCDRLDVSNTPRYGYRQRVGSAMNSVPDKRVLMDEMDHRRDIVLMIEANDKKVEYAGSGWLEGYFTDQVGSLIVQKPAAERAELWNEWLTCVREMKDAKGLSPHARWIYRLCSACPCRLLAWFLARACPWYRSRGMAPRAWRKVKRVLRGRRRVLNGLE